MLGLLPGLPESTVTAVLFESCGVMPVELENKVHYKSSLVVRRWLGSIRLGRDCRRFCVSRRFRAPGLQGIDSFLLTRRRLSRYGRLSTLHHELIRNYRRPPRGVWASGRGSERVAARRASNSFRFESNRRRSGGR